MRQVVPVVVGVLAAALLVVGYGKTFFRPPPPPDVIEGEDGWLYPGWDRLVDERPRNARAAVKLVAGVNRALAGRGERLLLLVVPNKGRVVPEHLPASRRALVERSHAYQNLIASLRAEGVEVLDTYPLLSAAHRRDGRAYSPRDAHWTARTAEQASAAAAPLVRAIGDLPGNAGDGDKVGEWEPVRRYADLVLILRRQGVVKHGEDGFEERAYIPPTKGWGPVAVVGSSFVDRRYGFPQMLSQLIDRRVELRVRFGLEGAWEAMAEHLRDRSAPPRRVVIWQLSEGSFSADGASAAVTEALSEPRVS